MLKIFGRANSINVRKVLWLAEEIGLAYTREDWGRGFRPLSEPEFQRVSRFGAIPVIDDDGFILTESNTIARYLAAKHLRTDLYPSEIKARASVEAWMDWGSTDLYDGVRPVFHGYVTKVEPYGSNPALVAEGVKIWSTKMRMLDDALAGGTAHLAGDHFTIADIPTGLAVHRWYAIPFEKPSYFAVAAYYERLSSRAAFMKHGRNGLP